MRLGVARERFGGVSKVVGAGGRDGKGAAPRAAAVAVAAVRVHVLSSVVGGTLMLLV